MVFKLILLNKNFVWIKLIKVWMLFSFVIILVLILGDFCIILVF